MGLGLTHRIENGVLRVHFDRPREKVNLLSMELLEMLAQLLDDCRARDDVRGLLFISDKPGMFLAGMDVEQIGAVTDGHRAAEAARLGQATFGRIADFGRPSVAAIGGTCLGGGTELVLACDFRLAAETPEFKIGLPETQLGIVPGFGGTQRLPRLIGLPAATDLILSGRQLDGRAALRAGLIDRIVPPAYLEREALALLQQASERGRARTVVAVRRRQPWTVSTIGRLAPLRRWALARARKQLAERADPRSYPAPFRALEAIDAAFALPEAQGFDLEARLVGELVPSPTAKNLIWLFQSQTALKSDDVRPSAVPRRVRRVAVLGAGIMGGGIAQLVADHELAVRLKDLRYDAILTALQTANDVWQRQVRRKRLSPRRLAQKMAFIAPTLDDRGLATVDLVLEAVVERLDVKRQVLSALEARIGERTVFASNTSSLPISDIAERAMRPERVVGLHFFNPVHRMPLVEIIAGRESSPEALATVHALAVKLGKVPILVKDGPGFLVNRILTFYVNEAMRLLVEGSRIETIDRAMTSFGLPVGPLALLDQIGLDTAAHVGEVLRAAFGKRAAGETTLLTSMVGAECLGRKSGRGFYRWKDGRREQPDPEVYSRLGRVPERALPTETIEERMVLAMVNEAALCLEEGVVREPRDVDVAMVMGTGFPPFRGGLLRWADAAGIPVVTDRLSRLADAHGERFRPAGLLGEMVRGQQRFYPS